MEAPEPLPKSGVSRWTCALTAEQLTVRFTAPSETRRRTPRATIQDIASPWHYTIQPSCRTAYIDETYQKDCEAHVTVQATDGSATYSVAMHGRPTSYGDAIDAWYFAANLNPDTTPERVISMIWSRASARVQAFDHVYAISETRDYSIRLEREATCALASPSDN